tara:strand:- start:1435 stop:1644 length:210 start_codon:yes stop_codon:yes gene_type:complete
MINLHKKVFILIFFYFILISRANAYIDPGSGSIILQAIVGALAAGSLTIKFYWSKIKNFFKKKKKDKID